MLISSELIIIINLLCCFVLILYFQNINPIIAKKMQEDRGRDYMNARRVAKEYEVVTKGLNKNTPSAPPQNIPDEIKQVNLFFNLLCGLCSSCLYVSNICCVQ